MLASNFQLIAIGILEIFALRKEKDHYYHGHWPFGLNGAEELKYSKDGRATRPKKEMSSPPRMKEEAIE